MVQNLEDGQSLLWVLIQHPSQEIFEDFAELGGEDSFVLLYFFISVRLVAGLEGTPTHEQDIECYSQ